MKIKYIFTDHKLKFCNYAYVIVRDIGIRTEENYKHKTINYYS